MTIRNLKDVPRDAMVGKFICTKPLQMNLAFGWPARVESTTATRLTYRRLPRGKFDKADCEWQVLPVFPNESVPQVEAERDVFDEAGYESSKEYCQLKGLQFICDTAEEAISLYVSAVRAHKAIEAYRLETLRALDRAALAGELPTPAYLAGLQA